VKHPYALTVQACRQRQRLEPGLRARLDRVILGLRLVPTIGVYDAASRQWTAHVAGDLRITYQVIEEPRVQVVILQIVPMTEYWCRELRAPALAGASG
jgi:hypothetical protein